MENKQWNKYFLFSAQVTLFLPFLTNIVISYTFGDIQK